MTVHQLLTRTIPPVDWDEALRRMLERYPSTEPPGVTSSPSVADSARSAAEQILEARAAKDPKLAAKQARLLEKLKADLGAGPPPVDTNSAAPGTPRPKQ